MRGEQEFAVIIGHDGALSFVWDDVLQPLATLGLVSIQRASHVEATADGAWEADMSPSGGPLLGPFALRGEALAAERDWLALHRGL